ncbi:MAG: radical SAM protein [bacterium]|nr:radical SAM protein [bacterium]
MSGTRKPYYVDWAITRRCNLRCAHCRGNPAGELPTGRALELVGEMASLRPRWILVEGGEPLMREDLFDVLGRARALGLETFVITNGMLLDDGAVARLAEIGVRVMVSIDSPDPETFGRLREGADLGTVVSAARRAAAAGILSAVNATLSLGNLDQIPDLFRLSADIGAPHVNLLGLKPCEGYDRMRLGPAEYRRAIEAACRSSRDERIGLFFDEPFFETAAREWGCARGPAGGASAITISEEAGCIIGKYIFMTSTGEVWPCSFSPLVMGDVAREPLPAVWERMGRDARLLEIMDRRSRKGACGACRFAASCGGCRARSHGTGGDWLAEDPVCPLKEGA